MRLLLIALALSSQVDRLHAERMSPADPRIRYIGRWERSDPSNPWCAWQGSSIQARFRGTEVSAVIQCDREEYIRVIIDNDSRRSTKLKITPGKRNYVLASKLPPAGK